VGGTRGDVGVSVGVSVGVVDVLEDAGVVGAEIVVVGVVVVALVLGAEVLVDVCCTVVVPNCSIGCPANAPSMNNFQVCAGSVPPVTSLQPQAAYGTSGVKLPVAVARGRKTATTASSCGV
jgi:hypothetical protein